ncbi:MAG: NAD-dependent epimerase/dehydratase family protein, partial [Candidatus Omnitrophica bacterium]|nr:NAD-dependent epimerase/dehydratase family protein [Candidatus Omnitrophota bacterium]
MRNAVIEEDLKFITDCRNVPWERLEGKNILISGANGFLPSYIVETVLFLNETRFNKKATVFALVRNRERTQERFQHYAGRKDLVFIVQDVCVPVILTESIDFIIHAASQASPKFYGKDPVGTLSANILGTHNLLTLAYEKKSEAFLFISSGEVYGEVSESTISIKEDMYGYLDPTLVRSCYAEGKRAGEALCVCWSHQYGVPTTIVRPG